MWAVCITSINHVLKLNGYGRRQAKVNGKRLRFKGWETLVTYLPNKTMLLLKSIPLALLLTTPWFQVNHKPTVKAQATKVYICTGPKAQVFHATSNCSGLSRCSGSIVSLTEAQARAKGRRPCKKCY